MDNYVDELSKILEKINCLMDDIISCNEQLLKKIKAYNNRVAESLKEREE